jgi:hypothetical protein
MNTNEIENSALAQIIPQLLQLQQKPAPFTPGGALFWDDPHISTQMLEVHLNPDNEAASRSPQTIDRCVKWMIETTGLKAGDSVLDLGCGPVSRPRASRVQANKSPA